MELAQHSFVFVQHLENVSLIHFGVSLVTMETEVTAKGLRMNKANKKYTPIKITSHCLDPLNSIP